MKIGVLKVIFVVYLAIGTKQVCTPGSCLYCDNDGGIHFCKRCGNYKVLSGKFPDIGCSGQITMPHCWEADSKIQEVCVTCVRGYYLTKTKSCVKIPIKWCLIA